MTHPSKNRQNQVLTLKQIEKLASLILQILCWGIKVAFAILGMPSSVKLIMVSPTSGRRPGSFTVMGSITQIWYSPFSNWSSQFLHQPFPPVPRLFVVLGVNRDLKEGRDLSQISRATSGGTNTSQAPRLWGNPRKVIITSLG